MSITKETSKRLYFHRARYITQLIVILVVPILGLAAAQQFPPLSLPYFFVAFMLLIISLIALRYAGPRSDNGKWSDTELEFRYKEIDNFVAVVIIGGFGVFLASFIVLTSGSDANFGLQLLSLIVLTGALAARTMCHAFLAELKISRL